VVASLLDHVVQADESSIIVLKPLLQRFDGFGDLLAMLAGRSAAFLGTNEAIREDGLDQRKHLLALGLCPQDATGGLTLTAKLAVTMRVWGSGHGHHLFPGRTSAFSHELVQPWPQTDKQCIDHGTAGIQEPQGIGLRLLWQPHVVAEGLNSSSCVHDFSCVEHLSLIIQV
jgi:hypothetical protein